MAETRTEITPYFYGRSEHRLNAKSQVAVPARFRSVIPEGDLQKGLVLLMGEPVCIYCYTHNQFRQVVDKLLQDEEISNDANFLREFFANIYAVDLDSQGRIVLPQELREQAQISGKDVIFIGHNERIEIWNACLCKQEKEAQGGLFAEKRERLARKIFGP